MTSNPHYRRQSHKNWMLLLSALAAALVSLLLIALMVLDTPFGSFEGIPYWLALITCLGIVFEMIFLVRSRKEGID